MSSLSRRQFLSTAAAGAAALMLPRLAPGQAPASSSSAPTGKKPNIVFILADDMGLGDLGCNGQKILRTPNIDKLAAEGMNFTNAYAGSMVCAPSRCALMTGKHMGHATIRDNWEIGAEGQAPLRADEITVAKMLKDAGYATGCCGKWGLGLPGSVATPEKMGFDYFFGYNCQRAAHDYYPTHLFRNAERIAIEQTPEKRTYVQDLVAEESLKFIRDHKNQPFFLFCAWTLPHGDYTRKMIPSLGRFENEPWPEPQKVYAAMVERFDADLGRVMAQLKDLGLDENTLVLFASDNGGVGGLGGRMNLFNCTAGLRGSKAVLFEGGIRVPMIARWPGRIKPGATTDCLTAFYDFMPTAAEVAGAAAPAGTDGISILPTLLGRKQKPHDYLYWEQIGIKSLIQAVRTGDWKGYRKAPAAAVQLYDLKRDPAEKTDVAAQHPDVVKRIEQIMREAHTDAVLPKVPFSWANRNMQGGVGKKAAGKKKGKKAAQ